MKIEISTVENGDTVSRSRFAVRTNGEITMDRVTRSQVKDFLDGIDMRSRVIFDGEPILDFEDIDMWFGPRR